MAAASRRLEVLKIYKMLHRAKQRIFKGDMTALAGVTQQINDEFKKNKSVTDSEEIEKMLKLSCEVEKLLSRSVVQAVEKTPGLYELQMRPEIERSKNVSYTGETEGLDKSQIKCCQENESEKIKR